MRCFRLFRLLLSCMLGMSALHAQAIAEIAYDGLPTGITAETMNTLVRMPAGSEYDKTKLNPDRDRLNAALVDRGYLDADTHVKVNYVPGGVKLSYSIKAKNCYKISAVEVPGINPEELTTVLKNLAITPQTPCAAEVYQRLAIAFADKLSVNYLFIMVTAKPNNDKQTAIVVLSK